MKQADATIWCVNDNLSFLHNVQEETAARLAETHTTHIYFVAELTVE